MPTSTTCKAALAGAIVMNCLTALGPTQAQDMTDTDGFREIRVAPGYATSSDFIEVLLPFLRNHPENDEGNAGMEMSVEKEDAGYRVDILLTGYLDDSVYGEHYRGFVIRTSTGEWELLSMSVKPLCARGENVNGICTGSSQTPAMFLTPGGSPSQPAMCVSVASNDVLNVRSGPGTRFETVGALAPGDCSVALSDVCEGSWCEIRSATISGWVNTRYLDPVK